MIRPRARRTLFEKTNSVLETLEQRVLCATSVGSVILESPLAPVSPVQVDQSATPAPSHPEATLATTTELRLRVTATGIYLSAYVSGANVNDIAPTGTVDISDEAGPLGTVVLGSAGSLAPLRSIAVIPPGEHTFFALYSGDTNYLISQNSITTVLTLPTATRPRSARDASAFTTNTATIKERVRPTRALSMVPFGTNTNIAVPTPHFANVTFNVRH